MPGELTALLLVAALMFLRSFHARRGVLRSVWFAILFCFAVGQIDMSVEAATLPPGFAETIVPGPVDGEWSEAVGLTFDNTGRMFVWERTGRVWFRDPNDVSFTLLLNLSEEVGAWVDYGFVGFALDPNFRQNGNIYCLYAVDRHYLLNFGTANYNPNSNEYFNATIGRLTRFTCRASDDFRSVDPASRFVLIGETKQTGFPLCSDTHGVGSLVFGADDTLLVSCGDGASAGTEDEGGAAFGSFAPQAVADQILRPKENIGVFRSQLLDCLNGKVLRIDPVTGNGIPSNPFYDGANPRSPRSRLWALGLRNPFRMSLRPGSGSYLPADGNPGTLYMGNVGWNTWECLKVATGPAQNFGWPLYEGLAATTVFSQNFANTDAPNPLFPGAGCSQFFSYSDLLKEDTLAPAGQPPFNNPCNAAQKIPGSIPQFLHTRPVLDWNHASATARTPIYGASGQAQIAQLGSGNSPVAGESFQGNCAVGGTWYTGTQFPPAFQNSYFLADWGVGWIKSLTFDDNNKLLAVSDFLSNGGGVTCVAQHPLDGSLYYISYTYDEPGIVRKIVYGGNRTPVVAATADRNYGPSPLTVQFSSFGSADPDGQPLTYSWNFGDGTPVSTLANPSHTFTTPNGNPTKYIVTLTISDGDLSAATNFNVSANNTPPNVVINSPVDHSTYNPAINSTPNLIATVTDLESSDAQLTYSWQTLLHHNNHDHASPADTNHVSSTVLWATACEAINIYYYRVLLTVTDPAGLSTRREVKVFPNCGPNTPPVISDVSNRQISQDRSTGPLAITIGDQETSALALQLTASSSNPGLVPNSAITFGGSGSNRTVMVTPVPGLTGTATITISVNDGPLVASDNFVVTVNPALPGTATFANAAPIDIPSVGNGAPYPSYITVNGMGGTVSSVTATLSNLTHTWTEDIDVLLVGPAGQKVILMSDVGAGAVNAIDVTLADGAATALAGGVPITAGTFKPGNAAPAETFSAPAPAGPYASTLATFNGQTANGSWALYFVDDGAGDQGSCDGGWSLTVTTVLNGTAPVISVIADRSTLVSTPVTGVPFTISDGETPAGSLTLIGSSSNPALVPDANITFGGSGNNRTVSVTPVNGQNGAATITIRVTDGHGNWTSSGFIVTVGGSGSPPSISDITDQSTAYNTPTSALSFTVGDPDTPLGSLTLSGHSSNGTLVPDGNIVFGGGGSSRTVTLTPALNQAGTTTITITVSDGALTAEDTFLLTVAPPNTPPTISDILDRAIDEDANTGAIGFTIGDGQTAVGSLTLSGSSSDQAIVPDGNIVFGGSGANRTVTVTPLANQHGSVTITVTVNDGAATANDSFVLTVNPLNDPPSVSALGDLSIGLNSNTGSIPFTVADPESAAGTLIVSGSSDNQTLVPDGNITFGGSGANRTVTVTPLTAQSGSATITVHVSDGQLSGTESFLLTVTAFVTGNFSFTNNTAINIPEQGNAAPYPSTITVGSLNGMVTNVTVILKGLSHSWSRDLDILLVGPGGQRALLCSDAGNGQADNITLTLADSAAEELPDTPLVTGTFQPFDYEPDDILGAPAPAGPYTSALSVFNGQSPNGPWSLYIYDDGPGDFGALAGGWVLNLTTIVNGTPPTISDISDRNIDEDGNTGPISFNVGDAETPAASLTLSGNSSNQGIVPDANLAFGGSGANRTLTVIPLANQNGPVTITVTVSDGLMTATDSFLLTVNALNDTPTISAIGNLTIGPGVNTGPLGFTIGDAESPAAALTVSGTSSDPALVPQANIVFGGSGPNRTVTIVPALGRSGTTTIDIDVDDGLASATSSFVLTVTPAGGGTASFANTGPINIPPLAIGAPYPSTINVAAMLGAISAMNITLSNVSLTWPEQIDMLLASPAGQKVVVMSAAGGAHPVDNATLTFAAAAPVALPDEGPISSGTFAPSDYGAPAGFPPPAPAAPYSDDLADFNGHSANGMWSLFVVGRGTEGQGTILNGWSLTLTTTGGAGASLAIVGRSPANEPVLQILGAPGRNHIVQASPDLVDWDTLGTVVPSPAGSVFFTDDQALSQDQRFYRLILEQ